MVLQSPTSNTLKHTTLQRSTLWLAPGIALTLRHYRICTIIH